MKTIITTSSFILFFVFFTPIIAGTTLSKSLNLPVYGDVLKKKQIEYKDPGRTGSDVLWDFSKLKMRNTSYKVKYYKPASSSEKDSTLFSCIEHKTVYNYKIKGDSFLILGYENPNSRLSYSPPQYALHFPFTYGDSISCTFNGEGIFEHTLSSELNGRLTVVADAEGILVLPDGDTIINVLRVRSVYEYLQRTKKHENEKKRRDNIKKTKDSIMTKAPEIGENMSNNDTSAVYNEEQEEPGKMLKKLKNIKGNKANHLKTSNVFGEDSLIFTTEICRWYAQGYRYPLFETIRNFENKNLTDTTKTTDFSTAFIFSPIMQDSLDNDPKNKFIRDSISKEISTHNPAETLQFHYNLYPNPVRANLVVELLLDVSSRVTFEVSSLPGEPLLRENYGTLDAGTHTLNLPMERLRAGYYALRIQVNHQSVRIVILKK